MRKIHLPNLGTSNEPTHHFSMTIDLNIRIPFKHIAHFSATSKSCSPPINFPAVFWVDSLGSNGCKTYVMGLIISSFVANMAGGTFSHLKWRPQLNPPRTSGLEEYSKVSALIMSMIGMTTAVRFGPPASTNRLTIGSSQPSFTSTWLSRNTRTCDRKWRLNVNHRLISEQLK